MPPRAPNSDQSGWHEGDPGREWPLSEWSVAATIVVVVDFVGQDKQRGWARLDDAPAHNRRFGHQIRLVIVLLAPVDIAADWIVSLRGDREAGLWAF